MAGLCDRGIYFRIIQGYLKVVDFDFIDLIFLIVIVFLDLILFDIADSIIKLINIYSKSQ